MKSLELISFYLLFGFLGFLFEMMIGAQKNWCGDNLIQNAGLCIPFLNIYAFGGILILLIRPHFSPIYAAIISGIILTLFECLCGHLGQWFNAGPRAWNYKNGNHFGVFCDGYTSLDLFLFWTLIAFVIDLVMSYLYVS
jgi:uncharacterized membrane protein